MSETVDSQLARAVMLLRQARDFDGLTLAARARYQNDVDELVVAIDGGGAFEASLTAFVASRIAEYRSQLAEARAHCITLAQQLTAKTEFAGGLARELDEARIELARKDERIAELERQLEVAAWRERLGGL